MRFSPPGNVAVWALTASASRSLKGEDTEQRTFQIVLHGSGEDPLLLVRLLNASDPSFVLLEKTVHCTGMATCGLWTPQAKQPGGLVTKRHVTRLEPKGGIPRVCSIEEEVSAPV